MGINISVTAGKLLRRIRPLEIEQVGAQGWQAALICSSQRLDELVVRELQFVEVRKAPNARWNLCQLIAAEIQ